jgi:hypothetical protein
MSSAVHPTTDIAKLLRHVRFVPEHELTRTTASKALIDFGPFLVFLTNSLGQPRPTQRVIKVLVVFGVLEGGERSRGS